MPEAKGAVAVLDAVAAERLHLACLEPVRALPVGHLLTVPSVGFDAAADDLVAVLVRRERGDQRDRRRAALMHPAHTGR